MAAFGAVALMLAAIGIYGLMAYSVAQRGREIGIRLALGAHGSDVRLMVVRQGMRLAVTCIVIGLAAAFALARFVSTMVYEVDVHDPFVFTAAPAALALVALASVLAPAVRAGRVDPVIALTTE